MNMISEKMLNCHTQKAEDQDFPQEITNLVGKKYAFKVSIDEVNAKKMLPVFTVLRLTDDADIMKSIVVTATPVKVIGLHPIFYH